MTQAPKNSILTNQSSIRIPMEASITTLSTKFQISIPKAVREEMHWAAGQEFVFIPKGKAVLIMPVPELQQLRGLAKGANTNQLRDRQDRV
jgi:AbrB family looped-hinge helix DNA binding protein